MFGSSHRFPFAAALLLIASIFAGWLGYIYFLPVGTFYAQPEAAFFRGASFLQTLGIMDFLGAYKRFSPFGLGLVGYLDFNFLVPALGLSASDTLTLSVASRLAWLHPTLLAATCATAAFVTWRLFRNAALSILAIILIGLNDAVPFQFRFVSTLACYLLQIAALWSVYFLSRLEQGKRAEMGALLCVAVALGVWEQGLSLALAIALYLSVVLWLDRKSAPPLRNSTRLRLLVAVCLLVAGYLALRAGAGAEEALSINREASYFLSYRHPLLMLDDALLNVGALAQQSFRQFLPFPPLSWAVMLGWNMNELNPYNAAYAQFPGMPYRMMGLWYAGLAFGAFLATAVIALRIAARSEPGERNVVILALCIFVVGMIMHVPIMHRDYFYIPGFATGYKISISYVGFVLLMIIFARRFIGGAWFAMLSSRWRVTIFIGACVYLIGSAIFRAAFLNLPQNYPW